MAHGHVVVEELEALGAVQFFHETREFFAAAEDLVEFVVPEADAVVVCDGAAVVYLADVGPHACAEAHVAGLASGVEHAAGQIEGAELLAGGAYGGDFSVAGGVVVL